MAKNEKIKNNKPYPNRTFTDEQIKNIIYFTTTIIHFYEHFSIIHIY